MSNYFFPEVTLLITHYNRSASLHRLLSKFAELNCTFGEIIISDDGSEAHHLSQINSLQQRFNFKLVGSVKNEGLGKNLNKGQLAATLPLTLYVQEDFVPTDLFPSHFKDALGFMDARKELDLIRFYAYFPYPYLKPYQSGFSEMIIAPWQWKYRKIYAYSDHPHLRRSTFLTKFGKYHEGIRGDRTEYRMCLSFIQKKGCGLFYESYKTLFTQINPDSEPSTMTRSNLSQSNQLLIRVMRDVYRQIKYNFDIVFNK
jgi:glycosyltransferase involved in cell wall biosynthesis